MYYRLTQILLGVSCFLNFFASGTSLVKDDPPGFRYFALAGVVFLILFFHSKRISQFLFEDK